MARQPTVLITGASAGIGKAIAETLLQHDYTVIVAARRVAKMEDLAEKGAHPIPLDISKEESIAALVAEVEERYGGVDILINNAGFGLYGPLEDIPLEAVRYQFEVNLFGLARLTQLLLPHMRAQGSGKIVNISSMGARMYTPLGGWYHSTKHALEGLSDCLRLDLKQFGIDVILIQPGLIETEFGDVVMEGSLGKYAQEGPYAPLTHKVVSASEAKYHKPGHGSSPQLIADTVLKAITARRPRPRYVAGKYARSMMGVRKWLGDRVFDRLVFYMLG